MDLMQHPLGLMEHPKYTMTRFARDPVPTSPLSRFLEHLKGKRKLKTSKTHPKYLQELASTEPEWEQQLKEDK